MSKSQKARQDKLRRALRGRVAQIPPQIARLGNALWDESVDTLGHEECVAALPAFAGAEVDGLQAAALYPEVKRHLDRCESCAAQYVDLLQVALADVGDALPQPDSVPTADLSFLDIHHVALRDSVQHWAQQILMTLSPQQMPGLHIIADVFFEQVEELGGKFSLQGRHAEPLALRGSEPGAALAALALSYAAAESLVTTLTPRQIDEWFHAGTLEQAVEAGALSAAREINLDAKTASLFAREFAAQVAKDPASLRALIEEYQDLSYP